MNGQEAATGTPPEPPHMSMIYGGHTYTLEVERIELRPPATQTVEMINVYLDGGLLTRYARCI